jgi:hypothetical protein
MIALKYIQRSKIKEYTIGISLRYNLYIVHCDLNILRAYRSLGIDPYYRELNVTNVIYLLMGIIIFISCP